MNVRDLKQWQWVAIGVVVGVVLAAVHLYNRPGHTDTAGNVISPGMFAAKASRQVGREKQPGLRNVVIHPPMRSASAGGGRVQYVTGEVFDRVGGGKNAYKPFHLYSPIPFVTDDAQTQARGPEFSLRHFLDEGAVPGSGPRYTYAWWLSAPVIVASRLGLSVLAIGVVWPLILNLLVGAGFGGPQPAEVEYDLSRFTPENAEAKPSLSPPAWEPPDEIAGVAPAPSDVTPSAAQPSPVKALSGDSEPAQVSEEDSAPHEYRGEFYPVEKPSGLPADPRTRS